MNSPFCNLLPKTYSGGFQEVWYLKLNNPASDRALWLRFTLLLSKNGFRKISETWAIYFHRNENKEISKLALKETFSLESFQTLPQGIKINSCELSDTHTRGKIQSKGNSLEWDFEMKNLFPARGQSKPPSGSFDFVPPLLARLGLVKNKALTVFENLAFTGSCTVNGEKFEWKNAPGMQGHLAGPKNGHSWVWGHCNFFLDESGTPVPFIFEGISAKSRIGNYFSSPKMSSFYFYYRGEEIRLNSLWSVLRSRSQNSLTEWNFQADTNELSFRGQVKSELRNFAGVTYEDTDGSFLYCANSKLSEMSVHVFRNNKLESSFHSPRTTAFEMVSRQKSPYVPLLL